MKEHHYIAKAALRATIIAAMLFTLALPTVAADYEVLPAVEVEDMQEVAIHFTPSGMLRITGAKGLTVSIYNLTGVKIATYEVGSDDETIRVNLRRGGYIVKVGNVNRKIAVTR